MRKKKVSFKKFQEEVRLISIKKSIFFLILYEDNCVESYLCYFIYLYITNKIRGVIGMSLTSIIYIYNVKILQEVK